MLKPEAFMKALLADNEVLRVFLGKEHLIISMLFSEYEYCEDEKLS